MASTLRFETQPEKENERKGRAEAQSALREKRRQILNATATQIGPAVRDSLTEYFSSMGLCTVDDTGEEHVALFKEEEGIKGHTWRAWSMKKTGTHSEYRTDGVHLLDEHSAYTITVSLVVNSEGVPLLHLGNYTKSKLVGGAPVIASDFGLEIPSQLGEVLQNRTGIKLVGLGEYLAARDN
jgi:hypothetical protein